MPSNSTPFVVLVALLVVAGSGSVALAATDGGHAEATAPNAAVQEETTEQEENDTEENETSVANITFANQTSDGNEVVIEQATINTTKPPGGFVAVYLAENGEYVENVTENDTGELIGNSSFLDPGDRENLTVELNQTLEESQTLVAVVHRDATGDEQFQPDADQPVTVDDQIVADAALVNVSATDAEETTEAEA